MKNKTKFYERIISIATMLTIVASIMIFVPRTSVNDTLAIEPIGEEVGSQTTKVFSYEQVFQSYYDNVISAIDKTERTCSFDDFCNGYYGQDLGILEYTNLLIEAQGIIDNIRVDDRSSDSASYLLPSISDPDEVVFDPEYTPVSAFPSGRPYYCDNYLFDYLEVGDIIMETRNTFGGFGHTGIVVNIAKGISNGDYYIQAVDAVIPNVCFSYLDDARIVDYGVVILRPVCYVSVREDAADFCYRQVGDEYYPPFVLNRVDHQLLRDDVIDFDEWSCAELVFSAYYNAGLDMGLIAPFMPYDIYYCPYMEFVPYREFFDATQEEKVGNDWKIRIYNNRNYSVECSYNSKLCFENDAKNWSNLNDVTSFIIPAHQSVVVYVEENYFATTIAISQTIIVDTNNYYRHITFINGLDENTGRIHIGKTITHFSGSPND